MSAAVRAYKNGAGKQSGGRWSVPGAGEGQIGGVCRALGSKGAFCGGPFVHERHRPARPGYPSSTPVALRGRLTLAALRRERVARRHEAPVLQQEGGRGAAGGGVMHGGGGGGIMAGRPRGTPRTRLPSVSLRRPGACKAPSRCRAQRAHLLGRERGHGRDDCEAEQQQGCGAAARHGVWMPAASVGAGRAQTKEEMGWRPCRPLEEPDREHLSVPCSCKHERHSRTRRPGGSVAVYGWNVAFEDGGKLLAGRAHRKPQGVGSPPACRRSHSPRISDAV